MGKMTIHISAQIDENPIPGKIGATLEADTACLSRWDVIAKTLGSLWYEWTFSGADGQSIFPSMSGNLEFEVNSPMHWTLEIQKYKSPNETLNIVPSYATLTLYDSEGGTAVNSKTFIRYHANLNC